MGKVSKFFGVVWVRAFIGALIPAGVLLLCILIKEKIVPPCLFYKITGLYCPGCGSGRAFNALLHMDFALAFTFNPLMVLFLPFAVYYLIKMYIKYVFKKDLLPFFYINKAAAITLCAVIVAYWILRNIPCFPFTLLAPH